MSLLPRGASVGPTSQLRHLEGPQLHGDRPSALQPRGKPASRRALTDISNNKSADSGTPKPKGLSTPFGSTKKGLGLSARPSAAPKPTPRRAGLPSAGLGFGLGFGTPMGMRARPRPRKTPSAAAAPPAAAAAPPTVASAPSHSTAAVADDDDDEVGFCWNQRLGSDAELEALEAALDKEIDIDALLGPDLIVDGTAQCLPLDSSLDEGSDVDINAGL